VGLSAPDDAAVWKLGEDRALVVTTDFFTPVVDDPYDYGAIAAANSLSDVYAMGGQPFLALNIVALPPNLAPEISSEILRGGAEKAREAGVVIAGGHSVQDKEPKYGLIALGFLERGKMMKNSGAQIGDILVLSKPLGFGTTTTALKNSQSDPKDVAEVVGWMTRLNKTAAELATQAGVRGATDITGFGLLGHGWEMAQASGVGMRLDWERIPFTSGARRYGADFIFPGGAFDNRSYFESHMRFSRELQEWEQMLLFDPQTSGGLLLCVAPNKLETLLADAKKIGQPLWVIGEVVEGEDIKVI
jgi:selenide,water dikinase